MSAVAAVEEVRSAEGRASVRLRDVSKIYDTLSGDRVIALTPTDIVFGDREFVSVVGPSGCGKTTALKIIAGLEEASTGEVTVGMQRVDGPERRAGLVFQKPVLLPWRTIMQNVLLPAQVMGLDISAATERARELLAMVGLEGFDGKYPRELSGGMQQRASLVRSLVHDPEILLMDEPFAALDALTRDFMNQELMRIWSERQKTVIFVTHSIDESVLLSDRVIVMSARPGRILADVQIDLPRPRSDAVRAMPAFAAFSSQIRSHLQHEVRLGLERVS